MKVHTTFRSSQDPLKAVLRRRAVGPCRVGVGARGSALLANWQLATNGEEVFKIDPLRQESSDEPFCKTCTPCRRLHLPVAENIRPSTHSLHEIRGFRTEVACSSCSLPVKISHTRQWSSWPVIPAQAGIHIKVSAPGTALEPPCARKTQGVGRSGLEVAAIAVGCLPFRRPQRISAYSDGTSSSMYGYRSWDRKVRAGTISGVPGLAKQSAPT